MALLGRSTYHGAVFAGKTEVTGDDGVNGYSSN
jgi:hypothetical protein